MNRTDGPLLVGGQNENTNVAKPLLLDNSGNLKVAVTGAGSGGTSSVDESTFSAGVSAGTPAMGVYEVAPSTLTDGQLGVVAVNANRELKVEVTAGGGANASVSTTGTPVPASATYVGFQDGGGNLAPGTLNADGGIEVHVNNATSSAVTIADGADVAEGATSDAAVDTDTTGTVSGKLRGLVKLWVNYLTRFPASLGQKTMANSLPVVLASDQSAVAISAASLPLPTGASTLSEQQTQTTSLQLIDDGISTTGSAVPTKGFQATGTDGTNARALKTDTSGELQIDVLTLPALAAGTNIIGYVGGKSTYGSKTTLTTTNFSNLASGSGWQSAAITTSGARDLQFRFQTKGAAGSTAYVDFYLYESFSDSVYTDAATGSEGTFTASGRKNSRYLGSLLLNTTTAVTGMLRVSDVIAGPLPEKCGLIGINNSGGTISNTGGDTVFDYELIN